VTVYVNDERHPFAVTLVCHIWAHSLGAFLAVVNYAGVKRKWLQKLPKAFWMHFDITQSKRKFSAAAGAVETDRHGPSSTRRGSRAIKRSSPRSRASGLARNE
jgi:hypothetical protein